MTYTQRLNKIIRKKESHLVVGLDTDVDKIPEYFLEYSNPILEFNKEIIEATKGFVAGYKLNSAFYEAAGGLGLNALKKTADFVPEDNIKIIDAKRGDIENTAEQYASIFLDEMDFDSITVSPYMGHDSVSPFLSRKEKGAYILALTSNPGYKDFQMLKIGKKFLYEIVIESAVKWGDGSVGLVIGANHTKELKAISAKYPEIPLLIPGVGAQGSDLKTFMKDIKSENFLINSSRSIIYAADEKTKPEEFVEIITDAAEKINDSINEFIN